MDVVSDISNGYCFGRTWYFRLGHNNKDGAVSTYKKDELKNKLVVSYGIEKMDKRTQQSKVVRRFSVFNNFDQFNEYQQLFNIKYRYFYEVIFGEFCQKPHFDIDISLKETKQKKKDNENEQNEEKQDFGKPEDNINVNVLESDDKMIEFDKGNPVLDQLINALVEIFVEKYGIELNIEKDIAIYASHGKEKTSYHVVLPNYCHSNHLQAKELYNLCIKKINKDVDHIDNAVYSSAQNFRMLGSQKNNSGRVKRFVKSWSYNGKNIIHQNNDIPIALESLVSFTKYCKLLKDLDIPKKQLNFFANSEIPEDVAEKIVDLVSKKMEEQGFPFVFSIASISGGLILLKRLASANCITCNRAHDHDNPYLIVRKQDNSDKFAIYYNCRRNPLNKLMFNDFDDKELKEIVEEDNSGSKIIEAEMPPTKGTQKIVKEEKKEVKDIKEEVKEIKEVKKSILSQPIESKFCEKPTKNPKLIRIPNNMDNITNKNSQCKKILEDSNK